MPRLCAEYFSSKAAQRWKQIRCSEHQIASLQRPCVRRMSEMCPGMFWMAVIQMLLWANNESKVPKFDLREMLLKTWKALRQLQCIVYLR